MISGRVMWAAACMLALTMTGCAKTSGGTASASASPTAGDLSGPLPAGAAAIGDTTHGAQIFADNCSQCHGATGREGGVGPSLRDERRRKTYAQTIVWIENPVAPMPKLYPSPLDQKDVQDVAAFVQTR